MEPVQRSGFDTMLIGSDGMLGRALLAECARRDMPVDAKPDWNALDITDRTAVASCLEAARPSLVINAAGYTDVDGAESDELAADRVNRAGPANLAAACLAVGALLVHVSTDYVFDGAGDHPYPTIAATNPQGAYARTKRDGELAVLDSGCEHLIVRTSWLFAPFGKNFVRTIHELAQQRESLRVVNDQRARPTYAFDLAAMLLDLVEGGARGMHHATNDGEASWFDLACAVVGAADLPCTIEPCTTDAFPRPAPRPSYSVLDLTDTTAIIGQPRHWSEAVADCVRTMVASAGSC